MERRRRNAAELVLPEAIIQHIQSFLSGKESAQTTLIAKSWYTAWLTRPNVDLTQTDFKDRNEGAAKYRYRDDGFAEFARKTIQRYEDLNLKIESFRLWMIWWERDNYSFARELLVRAMKMGVTDLDFKLLCGPCTFVLPPEVLETEILVRLSVNGCRIENGKVSCSRLKSLILRKVHLEGDMILDIISSCPLIEKLVLPDCKCFTKVETSNIARKRILALGPFNAPGSVNRPINLFELHKLKCLFLDKVKIGALFFANFSTRFPCLNELTVHHCFGFKEIQIHSYSLEFMSFAHKNNLKASLDVPSIRKFKFSGSSLPSLSLQTASKEWKSEISLKCNRPSTSWFIQLSKFLTTLSMSEIFLSLDFELAPEKSFDYRGGGITGLPRPFVEVLILSTSVASSVCSVILDSLFWSCRPKVIAEDWKANNYSLELLCKTFVQEGSIHGLRGLEEVGVEILENDFVEWRPLPWKTLLDASACPEMERLIRFRLRWGLE